MKKVLFFAISLVLMLSVPVCVMAEGETEQETTIETTIETSAYVEEETEAQVEQIVNEESFDFGEFLTNYFDAQTVATIMSVLAMLGTILKLCSYVKSLSKQKAMTLENVKNIVVDVLQNTNKESTEKAINELVKPLEEKVGSIKPTLDAFAKVLALSQENTPQSRLAILELLQQLGNVSDTIVENAKAEVIAQVKEVEQKKEETIVLLDNIENKAGEGRV